MNYYQFEFDLPEEEARYQRLRCGDGVTRWVELRKTDAGELVGAVAFKGWVDIMAKPTLDFLADNIVIYFIKVTPDIDTLGYFITAWLEPPCPFPPPIEETP